MRPNAPEPAFLDRCEAKDTHVMINPSAAPTEDLS